MIRKIFYEKTQQLLLLLLNFLFVRSINIPDNNHQSAATVPITYIEPDGTERLVDAEIGQNMMQVAHDNDIELEGACGGELACSTCHLIFEQDLYNTLPEKEDEEDDMLDLAFEVTETSRLGCQILVRENFAGTKVQIPDDGF